MMINQEHTAAFGGCKGAPTPLYIDHLRPDQLRRRAADDRADAIMLASQLSAGAVAMLLIDAERCEARADEMDAAQSHIRPTFAASKGELLNRQAIAPRATG